MICVGLGTGLIRGIIVSQGELLSFVADASAGSESERSRLRLSLEDVGLVEDVDEEDLGVARAGKMCKCSDI